MDISIKHPLALLLWFALGVLFERILHSRKITPFPSGGKAPHSNPAVGA